MKPQLYDLNMNRIGAIRHATRVGYRHVLNDLWTASFSLPVMDEAAELCENLHYIVDIFDGDRSAGKYRLSDEPEEEMTTEGAMLSYSCEHVLAFLFDDRIDGYLEIGGTGVYTEDVIEHLLSLQTVRRWRLGRCDFHDQFQYGWENEDILNALFSIPKCFADAYRWTYDTDSYHAFEHPLYAYAEAQDSEGGAGRKWTTSIYARGDTKQANAQPHNNRPPYYAVYIWRRMA